MRRTTRGFTLIELMVVVIVLAGLTMVVSTALLRRGHEAPSPRVERVPVVAQAAPRASLTLDSVTRPLAVEALRLRVNLDPRPVLSGWQVDPRFEARVAAEYRFVNPTEAAGTLRFALPFDVSLQQANDVEVTVVDDAQTPQNAAVSVDVHGVNIAARLAPGAGCRVRVGYTASGRARLVWSLGEGQRIGRLDVVVSGPLGLAAGGAGLWPTAQPPGALVWRQSNVVTARAMEVELPQGDASLALVLLLCQLAGLSVLAFGVGLWYLGELAAPGQLERFRWGHFLLLAGNHVLFFAVFALLARDGFSFVALAAALGPAVGLVHLHARRMWPEAYVRRQVVPLALVTLVGCVVWVYLAPWRPLVGLAAVLGSATFVTLTWPRFSDGRAKLVSARRAAEEAAREAARLGTPSAAAERPDGPVSCHCVVCAARIEAHHRHCFRCGSAVAQTRGCRRCGRVHTVVGKESMLNACARCGASEWVSAPERP